MESEDLLEGGVVEGLLINNPEKVALYLDFVELFTEILDSPGSKKGFKNLGSKMISIGLRMMILAPDPVVKAFTFWKGISSYGQDNPNSVKPETVVEAFGAVIMEMRKDLVGETECRRDDVLGIFLKD